MYHIVFLDLLIIKQSVEIISKFVTWWFRGYRWCLFWDFNIFQIKETKFHFHVNKTGKIAFPRFRLHLKRYHILTGFFDVDTNLTSVKRIDSFETH